MPKIHSWRKRNDLFFLLPSEQARLKVEIAYSKLRSNEIQKKLGISRTTWFFKQNGEISWSIQEFGILCRLIGCTPREILCNQNGKIELRKAS